MLGVRVADRSREVIMGRSCFAKYLLAGKTVARRRRGEHDHDNRWKNHPSWFPCTGSSVASRLRMISFGARLCAFRKRSTDNRDR
jgi:hypothetical protein